jgi:hypothetical protein
MHETQVKQETSLAKVLPGLHPARVAPCKGCTLQGLHPAGAV